MIDDTANSFEIGISINERVIYTIGYADIAKMLDGLPKLLGLNLAYDSDKKCASHRSYPLSIVSKPLMCRGVVASILPRW